MSTNLNRLGGKEKPFAITSTEKFIGTVALGAAIAVVAGVGLVNRNIEASGLPITERPHRELIMRHPAQRLWGIAQRAHPGMDPREAVYEIVKDQPEGFDVGSMQVGDTIFLETDAKIGKLVDPKDSATGNS